MISFRQYLAEGVTSESVGYEDDIKKNAKLYATNNQGREGKIVLNPDDTELPNSVVITSSYSNFTYAVVYPGMQVIITNMSIQTGKQTTISIESKEFEAIQKLF